MPTGYTAPIAEGKPMTFKQFALRCSRAFGALVEHRDESLDSVDVTQLSERTPNPFYDTKIAQDEAELAKLTGMTPEEIETAALHWFLDGKERWSQRMREGAALNARYAAMLEAIDAWEMPSESHRNLRDFMCQQIQWSIFDPSYDTEPVQLSGAEWHKQRVEADTRELNFYREQREAEIQRCAESNRWVAELVKSLG